MTRRAKNVSEQGQTEIDGILRSSSSYFVDSNSITIDDFRVEKDLLFSRIVISRQYVPCSYKVSALLGDIRVQRQVIQRWEYLESKSWETYPIFELLAKLIRKRVQPSFVHTLIDLAPHDFDPMWSLNQWSWCSARLALFHKSGIQADCRAFPSMQSEADITRHPFEAVLNEYGIDLTKTSYLGHGGLAILWLNDLAAISRWRVFHAGDDQEHEGLRVQLRFPTHLNPFPDVNLSCTLKSLEGEVFYDETRRVEEQDSSQVEFLPAKEAAKQIGYASVKLYLNSLLTDDLSGHVVRKISIDFKLKD